MSRVIRILPAVVLAAALAPAGRAADPEWVGPMKKVRASFTGTPGTLALFGDSITVSLGFWAPLEYAGKKKLDPELARDFETVNGHMKPECWRKWRGPEYGNDGSKTVEWADDHVDGWLKKLNPEAVVMMFGTNDLTRVGAEEYGRKTRAVVERCLKNGTVVLLTTIPPRSGLADRAKAFAAVQRKAAKDLNVPLIDYHAEILKLRPDDWDGSLPRFKDAAKGDVYQVPTLISADGVHPSNPKKFQDYSEEARKSNGYLLRNTLTLRAYADVIRRVLNPPK
jgi:hypothetical protein